MKKPVVVPATRERWSALAALFGERGACGGCWCMAWRRTNREYRDGKGRGNRDALRRLVQSDTPPGVLAMTGDNTAVGWCSVAPREAFGFLARSRVLAPVDDEPVWSISCLFIDPGYRGRGLATLLIEGAVELARSHGARIVEAYPVDPRGATLPAAFAWTGLPGAFLKAGFRECARRSPGRPVMRRRLRPRN